MTRTRTTLLTVVAALSTAAVLAPAALAASGPAPASSAARSDLRATLQRDADALLRQGSPGVLAELDTRRGDVVVRSGYGDVDRRTPVPWDAKFRIASFTKTFVATTALQLVGEGRLSLDDTVDSLLPGVVRGNGNDGRKITVRQLLQHTSGVPEYLAGMPELFTEEGFQEHRFDTLTSRQAVALAMAQPPSFAPGTQWSYSNTNYVLAGMIIEKLTGRPWQQEVQRRIVRPLGLRDTFTPTTSPRLPAPHAIGYERFPGAGATPEDPKYGEPIDATAQNPSWAGAAGAMISTTDDANRFLQALMGGRLLKPAQLAEMRRTVRTNAEFEENWPGVRYGLGIMWVPNSCGGSWSHGGDIMGFRTRNGVTADGSRSVVVSLNTDSFKPLPGAPQVRGDASRTLIDHALCGVR